MNELAKTSCKRNRRNKTKLASNNCPSLKSTTTSCVPRRSLPEDQGNQLPNPKNTEASLRSSSHECVSGNSTEERGQLSMVTNKSTGKQTEKTRTIYDQSSTSSVTSSSSFVGDRTHLPDPNDHDETVLVSTEHELVGNRDSVKQEVSSRSFITTNSRCLII